MWGCACACAFALIFLSAYLLTHPAPTAVILPTLGDSARDGLSCPAARASVRRTWCAVISPRSPALAPLMPSHHELSHPTPIYIHTVIPFTSAPSTIAPTPSLISIPIRFPPHAHPPHPSPPPISTHSPPPLPLRSAPLPSTPQTHHNLPHVFHLHTFSPLSCRPTFIARHLAGHKWQLQSWFVDAKDRHYPVVTAPAIDVTSSGPNPPAGRPAASASPRLLVKHHGPLPATS